MKTRCTNKNIKSFKDYGARGIKVCERWATFDNFLADMGEAPDGLSIDRINNDGCYEPGNCRWATPLEQSHNSRRPKLLTFEGVTLNMSEWAVRLGINVATLYERLEKWPLAEALITTKSSKWSRKKFSRVYKS